MKVGLVGFSGSGKSTLFQWLTCVVPDPAKIQQGQTGVAPVPDDCLAKMVVKFKPKKTRYADIAFLDTPGLLVGGAKDNPRRLGIIREADGLLIVLDGFVHPTCEQLLQFREEIAFADLEIILNRIDRLKTNLKKLDPKKNASSTRPNSPCLDAFKRCWRKASRRTRSDCGRMKKNRFAVFSC